MSREALLARTLVELADNLAEDFDVVDLLVLLADRCVEVLDVQAAAIMLVGPDAKLNVVASSSAQMPGLEQFQVHTEEGPCFDSYSTGQAIVNQNLDAQNDCWPRFCAEALAAGFRSAHGLPMRSHNTVIGALNLYRTGTGDLGPADLHAACAFAGVATITILQHHAVSEAEALAEQLQHALDSRVVIEQAKGILAGRRDLDVQQSFTLLRSYARSHNLRLHNVARSVIDGSLTMSELDTYAPGT